MTIKDYSILHSHYQLLVLVCSQLPPPQLPHNVVYVYVTPNGGVEIQKGESHFQTSVQPIDRAGFQVWLMIPLKQYIPGPNLETSIQQEGKAVPIINVVLL